MARPCRHAAHAPGRLCPQRLGPFHALVATRIKHATTTSTSSATRGLPELHGGIAQLSREGRERRISAADIRCTRRLGCRWRRRRLCGRRNGHRGSRLPARASHAVCDSTVGIGGATHALHETHASPSVSCPEHLLHFNVYISMSFAARRSSPICCSSAISSRTACRKP